MRLARNILIALVVGAVVGLVMNLFLSSIFPAVDQYVFSTLGTIFLNLIKMLVVPLVFFAIASGMKNIGNPAKLGRIGVRTFGFFLATTALAIIIALALALIIQPGEVGSYNTEGLQYEATEAPPVTETLLNIIPTNPITALATGNMLQIIFFAVFIGFALSMLGNKVKLVHQLIDQGNDIMMYLITIVMKFAPYGAFGLIASAIGKQGFDAIKAMGLYMIVVVLGLVVHAVVVYGSLIYSLGKMNPLKFYKEFLPAMVIAFSSSSSSATLPVSMDIAQKKFKVPNAISSFVQPLGATINMDGTAIMQGVAVVFIAQVFNHDLTFTQLLIVVLTAVLASIGTAAVPGAGLIMLALVLQAVGLPVEGIALIIGVDRLLDMLRTALNVTGDAICSVYVARMEENVDEHSSNEAVEAN